MSAWLCPYCGKSELIRSEMVIKGGTAHESLYCGHCDKAWRSDPVKHDHKPPDAFDDKPEPSRATKNPRKAR